MEIIGRHLPLLLILTFYAILFLQSGLDKVIHYAANRNYLQGYFAESPLSEWVGILLPTLTLLEVLSGLLCAVGVLQLLFLENHTTGWWGLLCSEISLLALFFGQRMAKDYTGAASLVPYFLVGLVGFLVWH